MGIIGSILRRRESAGGYRTIDGGHPAPYPDMTDEQLYNYEITFQVPRQTFDRPPVAAAMAPVVPETMTKTRQPMHEETPKPPGKDAERERQKEQKKEGQGRAAANANPNAKVLDSSRFKARRARIEARAEPPMRMTPRSARRSPAPFSETLDLNRPVRLITTRQPVEILTTRARHPIYKVHGYIGDADIATVFTLDGRLSENGPCFLENVPEHHELYLNIYLNNDPAVHDRYRITQHASREQADAAAADRVASVAVQFDL